MCSAMDVYADNYFDYSVEYFEIESEYNGIIRLTMYTPYLFMFMCMHACVLFLYYVC